MPCQHVDWILQSVALSCFLKHLQVLVMENGRIAEEGSHDELIKANGVYKRLVLRQLAVHSAAPSDDASADVNDPAAQ